MPRPHLVLPMPVEEFEHMEHRLGWKHEYWDGAAQLSTQETAVVSFQRPVGAAGLSRPPLREGEQFRPVRAEDESGLAELFILAFDDAVEFAGWPDDVYRQDARHYRLVLWQTDPAASSRPLSGPAGSVVRRHLGRATSRRGAGPVDSAGSDHRTDHGPSRPPTSGPGDCLAHRLVHALNAGGQPRYTAAATWATRRASLGTRRAASRKSPVTSPRRTAGITSLGSPITSSMGDNPIKPARCGNSPIIGGPSFRSSKSPMTAGRPSCWIEHPAPAARSLAGERAGA